MLRAARHFGLTWWLWALTGAAVSASLAGWGPGLRAALAVTAVQAVHQAARTRSVHSFPVQVRAAYLLILLAGMWPPLRVEMHGASSTRFSSQGACGTA